MRGSGTDSSDQPDTSSVLWKAFDVLSAFTRSRPVLTLSEISRRTELPKSTTHRILKMLLEVDAIERVGSGYKIGLRMFGMGTLSVETHLRDIAVPHLDALRRHTRRTVSLAKLQGDDVVYLEKMPGPLSPDSPATVGGRLPARSTGVGRVLLAHGPSPLAPHLEAVRRTGVALDRNGVRDGLACVAVPVLVSGQAVAALSIAFSGSEGTGDRFVNPLREVATILGRSAVGSPLLPT